MISHKGTALFMFVFCGWPAIVTAVTIIVIERIKRYGLGSLNPFRRRHD